MSRFPNRPPGLDENLSRLLGMETAMESCRLVGQISARDGEFGRDHNLTS
jgi:hypothetical protein